MPQKKQKPWINAAVLPMALLLPACGGSDNWIADKILDRKSGSAGSPTKFCDTTPPRRQTPMPDWSPPTT